MGPYIIFTVFGFLNLGHLFPNFNFDESFGPEPMKHTVAGGLTCHGILFGHENVLPGGPSTTRVGFLDPIGAAGTFPTQVDCF